MCSLALLYIVTLKEPLLFLISLLFEGTTPRYIWFPDNYWITFTKILQHNGTVAPAHVRKGSLAMLDSTKCFKATLCNFYHTIQRVKIITIAWFCDRKKRDQQIFHSVPVSCWAQHLWKHISSQNVSPQHKFTVELRYLFIYDIHEKVPHEHYLSLLCPSVGLQLFKHGISFTNHIENGHKSMADVLKCLFVNL